jgi:DNA repair protein SbcD/Mre11
MRFLHTADWHLGQIFHQYERGFEHEQFLNWLQSTLKSEKIDVLLLSGDIFDHANPAAASIRMFYSFLSKTLNEIPEIQIVVIAGNHDSAARLETPKPLLESSNVHIVGLIERKEGEIDYDNLIIPLKDSSGNVKVYCLAVPFLRLGDYPQVPNAKSPYIEGVTAFYKEACERAEQLVTEGQSIIAMGHLHTMNADMTDLDDEAERPIMGGVEGIAPDAFDQKIKYVALGHIHKAQEVGGRSNVRYSGSPIPLSFSEHNYQHQVIVFDIENEVLQNLRSIEVPVTIPLKRIPEFHKPLDSVLEEIMEMPAYEGDPLFAPYLLVRVLLSGPEPSMSHKINKALEGKNLRFLKIDSKSAHQSEASTNDNYYSIDRLKEIDKTELFKRTYKNTFNNEVPDELMKLYNEVLLELSTEE